MTIDDAGKGNPFYLTLLCLCQEVVVLRKQYPVKGGRSIKQRFEANRVWMLVLEMSAAV